MPPGASGHHGGSSTQDKNRQHQQRARGEYQDRWHEPTKDQVAAGQRAAFHHHHATRVPKDSNLEQSYSSLLEPVTTMMLRNIPNNYTQAALLEELNEAGFGGTYNFFYLPMDALNHSNVGYAFVNFLNPSDAMRCFRAFSDYRFKRFCSRKIGMVSPAYIQGLEKNLQHFQDKAVKQARNGQYRPVVIMHGRRVDVDEALVNLGKRKKLKPSSRKGSKDDSSGKVQSAMDDSIFVDHDWSATPKGPEQQMIPLPQFRGGGYPQRSGSSQQIEIQSGLTQSFKDPPQSLSPKHVTATNQRVVSHVPLPISALIPGTSGRPDVGTSVHVGQFLSSPSSCVSQSGSIGSGYPQYMNKTIINQQPYITSAHAYQSSNEPVYIQPSAGSGTPSKVVSLPPGLESPEHLSSPMMPPSMSSSSLPSSSFPTASPSSHKDRTILLENLLDMKKEFVLQHNLSGGTVGQATRSKVFNTNSLTPRTNVSLLAGCYGPASSGSTDDKWLRQNPINEIRSKE